MEILDMKCAQSGSEIASAAGYNETLITKALGVLNEDGVYAFFLYLSSKKECSNVKKKAFDFLKQDEILGHILGTEADDLSAIRGNLLGKLDELLFAKELLERALVYARYHAKAEGNSEGEKKQAEES